MSTNCTIDVNLKKCNCSYPGCERKGKCCLCLPYHRKKNQLPACFFHDDYEASYDRSLGNFLKMVEEKGMRTD